MPKRMTTPKKKMPGRSRMKKGSKEAMEWSRMMKPKKTSKKTSKKKANKKEIINAPDAWGTTGLAAPSAKRKKPKKAKK